ncbi:MAG TPA: hypothetical protein VF644_01460 [Pyrinomonadaceae bacterium]
MSLSKAVAKAIGLVLRLHSPRSSIIISLRKISRSRSGLLVAGKSKPRIVARTKTTGFRPYHLPNPVSL